jgi:hypothetical protein
MSKIRTQTDLSDALDKELSWRKKELSIIRSFIPKNQKKNNETLEAAIRCGVALLYAHWEGFIKNAGTFYVEYVANLRKPFKDLSSNFVAIGLRKELQEAASSSKMFGMLKVTDTLINKLQTENSITSESAVQTKSNLSPERFKEIVQMLGLDYSLYETKEKLLGEKLVKARHEIAHGKYLPYEEKDYILIHDEVIALMEDFRTQIDNAVSLKKFLISPKS